MALPEYQGWAHFLATDPPGDVRTHALLATLCALVHNALLAKGQKPKGAADYMPWLNVKPKGGATAKQAKADAEAAQAAANEAQVKALQARLRAQREAADS